MNKIKNEHEILLKQYEDMTIEEMSKEMEKNSKAMVDMLKLCEPLNNKEVNLMDQLSKAISKGDLIQIKQELLKNPTLNINDKDSEGTPPIIYAACFGKVDVIKYLIEIGANVDIQDNLGWTPLMWATNNNHELIVQLLLENNASLKMRSLKGRTVYDFVNSNNQDMLNILINPRDSTCSIVLMTPSFSSSTSTSTTDHDIDYQKDQDSISDDNTIESDYELILNNSIFHWDKCSHDQMFVFNSDDLDYILDTIIFIQPSSLNLNENYLSANVIFLSSRFAHYFSSTDLLEKVLDGAFIRIKKSIKSNTNQIDLLSYWITNLTQLLFYLKKDTGLVYVTAQHQLSISELISEIYTLMIQETESDILNIIGPAMLDHEEIPGMDSVDFVDDWHRFFRKSTSSRRSTIFVDSKPDIHSKTPHSIRKILSDLLSILTSFNVHSTIITQIMTQLFHFISSELFNRILTNKKLLCRSKAMQIRMNLSQLEDWAASNRLFEIACHLNPAIQLLQLLQCLTQLRDLMDFIKANQDFNTLNPAQIKRCVISYRYEVDEPKLPIEIEKYVCQCVQDTVKNNMKRQSQSIENLRRISFLSVAQKPLPRIKSQTSILYDDLKEEGEDDNMEETKDTKFMLPFSIPTTHMISSSSTAWDNQTMIPDIPEKWLDILDKRVS